MNPVESTCLRRTVREDGIPVVVEVPSVMASGSLTTGDEGFVG